MAILLEDGPDAGLAWHFGSPAAEGRLIESGEGIVDLGNREVVEVSGVDRLSWLHSLSSKSLASLAPGEASVALILSPTGHIEHVLHGLDDGVSFLAWTEPGRAGDLVAFLERMRFAMRVEVRRRADLRLFWVGERVALDQAWRSRAASIGGRDVFVPVAGRLPEPNVGLWAYDAARIAAGVPRVFVDTDFKTIPNEIGLFGTDLDKGCYRGQETVARVHTLGRPPRRLVLLHLDGSVSRLPTAGSPLLREGKQVGFVGSAALHHELGPIALGLVKRAVPVAAALEADGIPAAQEALVDPDVGLHVRPRL